MTLKRTSKYNSWGLNFTDYLSFSLFWKIRNIIFPDNTKKIIFRCNFSGNITFSVHLKKIYFHVFFFSERSCLILCLRNKIISSGKRNIIFTDSARKIIFQCNLFDHLFRTFGKKNMFFVPLVFIFTKMRCFHQDHGRGTCCRCVKE